MALTKNTAGQKLTVLALDAEGAAVTGDASNITCKVAKDHGSRSALGDTNPTETEAGRYVFDLTQAETNANVLTFYPVSATEDVTVDVLGGADGPTVAPNPSPHRTYYVTASGGNATGPYTRDDPGTLTGACAYDDDGTPVAGLAQAGDTIWLLAGDYDLPAYGMLTPPAGVTLRGDSAASTTIAATDSLYTVQMAARVRLLDLTIECELGNDDDCPILGASTAADCEIGRCVLTGVGDAIYGAGMPNLWLHHTTAEGTWDCVVGLVGQSLVEHCDLSTTGDNASASAPVALVLGGTATVRNTKLTVARTGTGSGKQRGLYVTGTVLVENVTIDNTSAHASMSGDVYGIEVAANSQATVIGGLVTVSTGGGGSATEYDTTASGSSLLELGSLTATQVRTEVDSNSTKLAVLTDSEHGNEALASKITDAQSGIAALPSVGQIRNDLDNNSTFAATIGGLNDLDATAVQIAAAAALTAYDPATAAKLLAYMRLLVRSDSEVATDLSTELAELNADTGTGTGSFDPTAESAKAIAAGVASVKVDTGTDLPADIAGIEAGIGGTVSAEDVPDCNTHRHPRNGSSTHASNTIEVNAGFAGTLAVDIANTVVEDTTITGTPTVTITGDATVTATNVRLHTSKRRVLYDVPTLSAGEYVVKVTFATADSNTIPLTGDLTAKAVS